MDFIGIGDLHLTSPGFRKSDGARSNNIGGLSGYIDNHDDFVADLVISQPLAYARKRGVEHIVLYGDIFEKPRGSYEGMLALERILEQDFQFHIILGNHDMFGEDPSLGHSLQLLEKRCPSNVKIYTKPTLVSLSSSAKVNFLPYPHNKFVSGAINVAHIDVAGAKTDSGRMLESDELPTSTHLGVVGHIHTNQKVRNTWYSGTLYQTNFGESPDKFFHHCDHSRLGWNVTNIPVKPIYRLHTIEVSSKKDLKDIPKSKFDLIKLILLSPDIQASDYADLNVVRTRAVTTEQDLAMARIEDLHDGAEVEFSVDEFFDVWLSNQPAEEQVKAKATQLRNQLLRK